MFLFTLLPQQLCWSEVFVSNRVNCNYQVYDTAHRFLDVDLVSRKKEEKKKGKKKKGKKKRNTDK